MQTTCCCLSTGQEVAVAVLLFSPGAAKQHFGLQLHLVLVIFFLKYKFGIFFSLKAIKIKVSASLGRKANMNLFLPYSWKEGEFPIL